MSRLATEKVWGNETTLYDKEVGSTYAFVQTLRIKVI